MPGERLAIRAEGLGKRYGPTWAVRGLDLTVRPGEIYGFLGPNGAGKTTTLLMLLGIERPTAGRVELVGQTAPVDPFAVNRRIGVVTESQYLYDDLSAWEYLQLFGRLYGVANAASRAAELLDRLGLYAFRRLRARDHSRGMQQKLGLARALLHAPELLVLDEPVSGLDPHGIRQVRELLMEQRAAGTAILISSHILSEVERTADRVGILYRGRLVAEDSVERIGRRLEPAASIEVDVEQLSPRLVEALRAQPFVDAVEVATNGSPDHGLLRLRVAPTGDHRRAISSLVAEGGGLIVAMRQERVSLEDAFVRLTAENVAPLAASAADDAAARGDDEPADDRRTGDQPDRAGAERRARDDPASDDRGAGGQIDRAEASRHARDDAASDDRGAGGQIDGAEASRHARDDAAEGGRGAADAQPSHELPDRPTSGRGARTSEPRVARSTRLGVWPAGRWRAVRTIAGRDLFALATSLGPYLALTLGLAVALVILRGQLNALARNRLLILSDAFSLPFFVVATIAMLFLALSSAATVAREREQGTLEVLFYGPVDHTAYVLGKHAAQLGLYAPMGLGIAALFALGAGITGLRLNATLPLELLLSLVAAAAVVALGLLLSTLTRSVRAAFGLFAAAVALFLAVRIGSEALTGIRVTNNYSPLLFARDFAIGLDRLLGYASPFAVLENGVDALVRGDALAYLAALLLALAQCAALLALSVATLRRRGVRR